MDPFRRKDGGIEASPEEIDSGCSAEIFADHPPSQRDGTVLSDEKEILARWREYFSELLNPVRDTKRGRTSAPLGAENSPTEAEVTAAINSFNSGKAAGVDEIRPDVLKALEKEGAYDSIAS
ncbi:UNVERIFIED_CONTAM: hypothetical protein PYX00_002597 [Menopon gallinae]|uniref:Uncharacterized protein n=1 Tax=Menopon gallinae TaxID=328185 RepID=A0AAW2II55_9NEOP